MKKIFLTLIIGGMSITFACDKCNLSNSGVVDHIPLQDYKKGLFERIINEEKRIASLKECINGNSIEEISACEKKLSFHPAGCDCQSCSSQQLSNLKLPFLSNHNTEQVK